MANRDRREALRGAEEEIFDLLSEVLTSRQWAELLKAPLERAAANGNRGLAQELVGAGAETGKALHEAVRGGHEDIVNDLLKSGACIDARDADGNTPLHLAAREGKLEMVELLMIKGADKGAMDSSQRTPLHRAIDFDHKAAALALLTGDANVNRQFTSLKWPVMVHTAAQHGLLEFLRAAIERGADLNAPNVFKHTALHFAATHNQAETIDVLIEAGANIESRHEWGATPLHLAACNTNLDAVLALSKHGADVNAQDVDAETPLHMAARNTETERAAEVVDSLLRSGADETPLNNRGETALDMVVADSEDGGVGAAYANRVRELLVNAPADRIWRRRGYLMLCRAHPDRVQLKQESSIVPADVARRTRSGCKLARTGTSGCNDPVGGSAVHGGTGRDWSGVVAMVVGLQEEGIFRTIVGYL